MWEIILSKTATELGFNTLSTGDVNIEIARTLLKQGV